MQIITPVKYLILSRLAEVIILSNRIYISGNLVRIAELMWIGIPLEGNGISGEV